MPEPVAVRLTIRRAGDVIIDAPQECLENGMACTIIILKDANGNTMNMPSRKVYALSVKKVRAFMRRRGFDDAVLLANTEELVGSEARPIKVLVDYKAPLEFQALPGNFPLPGVL